MSTPAAVAIVGGGASGCLSAAHLARAATLAGTRTEILLIEPGGVGRGLAYSTTDPRHRLNVPAKGMSAWPDDPEHFLRWMRRHVSVDFHAGGFAPRLHYADYLTQTLDEALRAAPQVTLTHLAARTTDLRRHGRRLRLTLDDGTSRPVDAGILATGHGVPSTSWAPSALRRSARFVADPWRGESEPRIPVGGQVLLVGAGLTMADVAMRWGRSGVRVHVASRHGMLPLAHAAAPFAPVPAPDMPDGRLTLAAARRFVFSHIRSAGDWRAAVDGLRPITTELWRQLDQPAQRAFLATAARRWDRVRHRVDPAVAAWLEQRRGDGSLRVHAASVTDARESGDRLTVTLSDGAVLDVDAVVNCTGTCVGVRTSSDPLVMNLLETGTATPGPLELGFATDGSGRIVATSGAQPAVWTIGPLRRGELWESTAVPEIRAHAASVAAAVVASLPSPRLVRRARDPYGLPLSANSAAAGCYVEAVGRILRVQSGAEGLVASAVSADSSFALGHAVLALLGVEWGADVDVTAALQAAHDNAHHADERERRFIDVATARVTHPGRDSAAALLAYIQTYPEDALAVSLAVPTIAFGGATELPAEAWALVEGLEPIYRGDWWYRSILAFVRQDQGRFEEAGELAASALAVEPASGHAVHAKTHVHYETGDHRAGLDWLDGWIASCGALASHRAHFSWHAALHELALGDDAAVAARYAAQLAPPSVSGVRALVDSASLLWRGYTAGAWGASDLGPVLAAVPAGLLTDPPTAFVAMHSAVALAAAGDCRGLATLRRNAAARADEVFTATVAPLVDSLMQLIHGDADRAADGLIELSGVDQLGGSLAQREIVEETLIHCAIESRRFDLAGSLLDARLDRRSSPRDTARRAEIDVAASVTVIQ
ncbi:MAG TPA: FAD/NAD(P)-binding protein [Jatrophihabitantaceae bacterium]|jgi:uncharacterized NAD(P)/FAD-binding protein YdhS|nr:FAD/NAD(P)-binding protein [Jatrophihabitantaceae bacterium]